MEVNDAALPWDNGNAHSNTGATVNAQRSAMIAERTKMNICLIMKELPKLNTYSRHAIRLS